MARSCHVNQRLATMIDESGFLVSCDHLLPLIHGLGSEKLHRFSCCEMSLDVEEVVD